MPINDNNLPPLRTIFDIDDTQFQNVESAFVTIDRVLPNVDNRLESIENRALNIDRYFQSIADNVENIRRLTTGGFAISEGQQTAFPISQGGGSSNISFPDSFDEEEGFLESNVQFREFYYGSNYPGFFGTFLGRALLGGSAAGAGLLGSQILPGSALRNSEFAEQAAVIRDSVEQGIVSGFNRLTGSEGGTGEQTDTQLRAGGYRDTYNFLSENFHSAFRGVTGAATGLIDGITGIRTLERVAGESLPIGTRGNILSSGFTRGFARGNAYSALPLTIGHGLYLSEEDLAYSRENDVGLVEASWRRAPFNSVGADSLTDHFIRSVTGDPFGVRPLIRGLFSPTDAEGLEIYGPTIPEAHERLRFDVAPPVISGRSQVQRYLAGLNPRVRSLVFGDDFPYEDITSVQDFEDALPGARINRVGREVSGFSTNQFIRSARVFQEPGFIGTTSAGLEELQDDLTELAGIAGEDTETGKFLTDLNVQVKELQDSFDNLISGKDSPLTFFERLEEGAAKAEGRFEGLEQASDNIGDAVARGFAQVAIEFREFDEVASEVLQRIGSQLVDLLVVNPLSDFISTGFSAAFGVTGATSGNAGGGLLKNTGTNYNEYGPEFLMNSAATSRYQKTLEDMNEGRYMEGGMQPNVTVNINSNDPQSFARYLPQLKTDVMQAVVEANQRPFTPMSESTQSASRSR